MAGQQWRQQEGQQSADWNIFSYFIIKSRSECNTASKMTANAF